MKGKEIRFCVDEPTHAAVQVLADSDGVTMDRWVASLVRSEVSKQLAVARQLTATISEEDLVRVETVSEAKARKKIYFIQRGTGGPIKIGIAAHVERRLISLQTACAEELKVLAVIDQTSEFTERKVHRRFRHLQRGGEWFACEPELLQFIASFQASLFATGNGK